MTHPDSGRIQAYLDGEVGGPEADALEAHLESCAECRLMKESLASAARTVREGLLLLDTEPSAERVKARLQARGLKPQSRLRTPRRTFGRWVTLPRAASIALLLTGAVATALPGSPVRRWVVQGWEALTGALQAPPAQEEVLGTEAGSGPGVSQPDPTETGASIRAADGGVEIWIQGLREQAELKLLWVGGAEAWVYAGQGTRFNLEPGRLVASSPPGDVRVEIPRTVDRVVVGLNGKVLMRKTDREVEILGPVQERTPSEILFGPSDSTKPGGARGPANDGASPTSEPDGASPTSEPNGASPTSEPDGAFPVSPAPANDAEPRGVHSS